MLHFHEISFKAIRVNSSFLYTQYNEINYLSISGHVNEIFLKKNVIELTKNVVHSS